MALYVNPIGPNVGPNNVGAGSGVQTDVDDYEYAKAINDELSRSIAKKGVVFISSGSQKNGDSWKIQITVRDHNDKKKLPLDKNGNFEGIEVEVIVDPNVGLH
jgi:hypothetical protein